MTRAPSAAPAGGYRETARSASLWSLAIAETLVWAGIYYLFPALIARWEADLGWSKSTLTTGLTLALVASALAAPLAGRLIDRGHARLLLSGCALAGGLLIGALTQVETRVQFYGVWIALGLVMAGCLYEPCFAFLVRSRGESARSAITLVTLVAGFAGTLSFPLANLVAEAAGWRASALTFTALICGVAVPLFWLGAREDRPRVKRAGHDPAQEQRRHKEALRRTLRRPAFWLLAVSFSLVYLDHGMIITHLLPLLGERGVALQQAVLVAALIGPMQVAGRVAMMLVERRLSINLVALLSLTMMVLAAASLMAAERFPLLLFGFVAFQGAGIGMSSITRPVVAANLLGREGFGVISGSLAAPIMAAFAVAPLLGAQIWAAGGYDLVVAAMAGMAVLAALSFLLALSSR